MRKIRRVCMTLALAVLLAGMTACGNNTTNDTGNGNTNTESDMGQTDNRNDVNTTEMPSNDNVNDVTEGTDGNANGTNGTNTGDRNTLGDDRAFSILPDMDHFRSRISFLIIICHSNRIEFCL